MSRFGHRMPSATRSLIGHRNIMQTKVNEPQEGEYFCFKKDGEDWPIVICDEEVIKTFFTHLSRPRSARCADGSWEKDYKASGISISDRRYPALNLGTMELIWASLNEIEPIELDMGKVIRSSTENQLLAKAWSEYILQFKGDKVEGWKDLAHWKQRLHAHFPERTVSGIKKEKMPVGKKDQIHKRKCSPKFRYPPGYCNEEVDDEEPEDRFLPKDNIAEPKIKRESINSLSSDEINALYDDADPPYPSSSQSSKRSKLDLAGRFSMRPSTPLGAGPGKFVTPGASVRHGTPSYSTNKNVDGNDPNTVIIYVDNPHTRFKVKRAGLDTSPLLSKLVTHHPENGWYIMSPMLSSIAANDFQPIGEYIDRREYHPNILDDGTVHVRLEGELSPEMLRHQVVRCGTVYQIAQMLEMPGLQDLAFRKLKALTPHYQPLEVLTVIELLFEIGGLEIRQYLIKHVADHYWNFVLGETEKMVEVMSTNEDLAKGVFGMLSGLHDGVKTKKEEEEEDEKEEVVKKKENGGKIEKMGEERKSGEINNEETTSQSIPETKLKNANDNAPSDFADAEDAVRPANTNTYTNNTDAAENHEKETNNVKEGLTQSEKDMLKTALRRSDDADRVSAPKQGRYAHVEEAEEAKEEEEEDWVSLVRKQEEIFEAF